MTIMRSLPDQHTLVLPHSPQGHVDLVRDGEDVWRTFPKLLVFVALHFLQTVNILNLFVGIDCTQYGAYIGLWEGGRGGEGARDEVREVEMGEREGEGGEGEGREGEGKGGRGTEREGGRR